ncbi:leucyl aminopeptidase [Dichotomicrobium thermohalophilum]|uniref:Probable cytosol aminopeptidase n=1 Tax=Dichotomicrobium thermohalophilum TaxID=933063 RepID=A0A397QAG1_9HYPH|nr:leucyl aminopeptidase [Dichotomicrobium thermohalophilum]
MSNPEIAFASLDAEPSGTVIVTAGDNARLSPTAAKLDNASAGVLTRAAGISKFKGKNKTAVNLLAPAGLDAIERLVVVGTEGISDDPSQEWIDLGGFIRGKIDPDVEQADLWLEASDGSTLGAEHVANVALGLVLRGYEFTKYKSKKKTGADSNGEEKGEPSLARVVIHCDAPDAAEAAFAPMRAISEGVYLARDLVNEPPNELGPEQFAERARALADYGVEVDVLDEDRMRELGMGALLAVGQGSVRPSRLVTLRWRGKGAPEGPPTIFVGKGVCFDTGGVSIKPAQGMEDMKGDMGGAACVAGLLLALAKEKAPVDVVGVLGLTENMVSGSAQRPSDIVKSMSGQTIEVLNTDAEGRMVLADAMWYAQETWKPKRIVTLATLTGAIIVALGHEYAGLYANDDALCNALLDAGAQTDEKVWRMPLSKKYDKLIDSKVADMKNIGGRWAGSITAAQFLQRFVQDDVCWAHIDIAGTAFSAPSTDINRSWGAGFGVRLLERMLMNEAQTGGA